VCSSDLPKPLTNLERLPDGTANRTVIVGDYTNPILRPGAAKTIQQLGEMARSGDPHPDPSNQCQSYPPPFAFSMQLGLQMLQAEDHVTILYNRTIRSAASGSTAPTQSISRPRRWVILLAITKGIHWSSTRLALPSDLDTSP
jgi:hypothetical protein